MIATYCFAERPHELFTEGVVRAWLVAIRDFPQFKSWDECVAAAQGIPDDLASDVCCIGENDYPYRYLVVYAWSLSYQAFARDISEREKVVYASALKRMPSDEALALVRSGLTGGDAQAAINEAYASFQCADEGRV